MELGKHIAHARELALQFGKELIFYRQIEPVLRYIADRIWLVRLFSALVLLYVSASLYLTLFY